MHQQILKNVLTSQFKVCVPKCYQYVHDDDRTWWDSRISKYPKEFQISYNVLLTERIPPFPKSVRETIINAYYPESLRSSIKSSEPDQDCLIRPYLGRRRRLVKQSRFQAFSLRNYPLHIDQIEELGLDGVLYAKIMAETLANLYWRAHVDANDMEFVLAPPRKDSAHPIKSHILGEHAVWILDFDCCKLITVDETGVEQAVIVFYKNDSFFPRPKHDNT